MLSAAGDVMHIVALVMCWVKAGHPTTRFHVLGHLGQQLVHIYAARYVTAAVETVGLPCTYQHTTVWLCRHSHKVQLHCSCQVAGSASVVRYLATATTTSSLHASP